jgi:hypothetical protein
MGFGPKKLFRYLAPSGGPRAGSNGRPRGPEARDFALHPADAFVLERLCGGEPLAPRALKRARVLLLLHAGLSPAAAAQEGKASPSAVWRAREAYCDRGLAGLWRKIGAKNLVRRQDQPMISRRA